MYRAWQSAFARQLGAPTLARLEARRAGLRPIAFMPFARAAAAPPRDLPLFQWFVGKHAIAAARLRADGVGPLLPVASNSTDAGRAKNRRVELVEQ